MSPMTHLNAREITSYPTGNLMGTILADIDDNGEIMNFQSVVS